MFIKKCSVLLVRDVSGITPSSVPFIYFGSHLGFFRITSQTRLSVRLTNQNFAAASDRRNEPIGVFIAGVLFPPRPSLILHVFCLNSLPPPLTPLLYTPATQATHRVPQKLHYKRVRSESLLDLINVINLFMPGPH